jgi:hypothetical protein
VNIKALPTFRYAGFSSSAGTARARQCATLAYKTILIGEAVDFRMPDHTIRAPEA